MAVAVTPIQRRMEAKEKDPLDTLSQVAQVGATIYGATKGSGEKPETMEDAIKATDKSMGPDKQETLIRRQQALDYKNGKRWG